MIAGDDPRARINKISNLVSSYDIIFFQENWIFSREELEKHLPGYHIILFEKSKFVWPFNKIINSNGSGLTTAIRESINIMDKNEISYSDCSGWIGEANDCLASKGFLYTRINYNGQIIDLYNTHLDAGVSADDQKARNNQISELDTFIKSSSDHTALILAGDLNVNYFGVEFEIINTFSNGLNLYTHKWNDDKFNNREILDYILYRGSDKIVFNVIDYSIDTTLNNLSDHPAIKTKINLTAHN